MEGVIYSAVRSILDVEVSHDYIENIERLPPFRRGYGTPKIPVSHSRRCQLSVLGPMRRFAGGC